jgi:hypothetical protein
MRRSGFQTKPTDFMKDRDLFPVRQVWSGQFERLEIRRSKAVILCEAMISSSVKQPKQRKGHEDA